MERRTHRKTPGFKHHQLSAALTVLHDPRLKNPLPSRRAIEDLDRRVQVPRISQVRYNHRPIGVFDEALCFHNLETYT
jgi:hypothetical protein